MQDRYQQIIIIALAAVVAAGIVWFLVERQNGPGPLEIDLPNTVQQGPMEVYITGAVAEPGVYEMEEGDRVVDALYEAGGPVPDADLEAINLALRLHDEDRIVVPRQGEAAAAGTSGVLGAVARPLIDINTATAEELDTLPGIGEVYSQRIVDSRTYDGPYEAADDLVTRRIIPRGTFERIQDLITLGP